MPRISHGKGRGGSRGPAQGAYGLAPGQLSAEAMSFKTGKPIEYFTGNTRVTGLPGSTVITAEIQIVDNLTPPVPSLTDGGGVTEAVTAVSIVETATAERIPAPARVVTPKVTTKKKTKPNSMDSAAVAAAVKEIGGILTGLRPEERFAVLGKVTGAFGYKPKGTVGENPISNGNKKTSTHNSDNQKERKLPKPKNSFNESYSKTLPGILLGETSKTVKKVTKGSARKVTPELHELHRYLLGLRTKAKEDGAAMPPEVEDPSSIPPCSTIDALLSSRSVLTQAYVDAGINPETLSPDLIFRSGLCLWQGKVPPEDLAAVGKIPTVDTWPKTPWTVQRTVEEAAQRSLEILASKKLKKPKGATGSDYQNPVRKRLRSDETATEKSDKESKADSIQRMDLEDQSEDSEDYEGSDL